MKPQLLNLLHVVDNRFDLKKPGMSGSELFILAIKCAVSHHVLVPHCCHDSTSSYGEGTRPAIAAPVTVASMPVFPTAAAAANPATGEAIMLTAMPVPRAAIPVTAVPKELRLRLQMRPFLRPIPVSRRFQVHLAV